MMKIEDMKPGDGGWIDPWNLVEQEGRKGNRPGIQDPAELVGRTAAGALDAPTRMGVFFLRSQADVLPAKDEVNRARVDLAADGMYTLDLTDTYLASPPRVENGGQLRESHMPCRVLGLEQALKPKPGDATAKKEKAAAT